MKHLLCGILLFITSAMNFPARAGDAPDQLSVSQGSNQFALDLYAQLRGGGGNLFFSPYSISAALAMTYAGARNETAQQMAEVLRFKLPPAQLHPAFHALNAQIILENSKGYQLSVANALWGKEGYPFAQEFLATVKQHYGAGLTPLKVDDPEGSARIVNDWVEAQTQKKIKDLVKPNIITPLTRLILTNAIYFKGDWARQFKKELTRDGDFRLGGGKNARVPMMNQNASFGYFGNDQLQMLELPYSGDELSMLIILPAKADGLSDLEKQLSADKLAEWSGGLRAQEVSVTMPKFKLTAEFLLNETLSQMGMPLAFSAERADFSGMTQIKEDLYISHVIHKAFVDVNEEGTEAAAATAVVIKARGLSRAVVFKADHPFVFAIRHKGTGAILFLGRVTDPR